MTARTLIGAAAMGLLCGQAAAADVYTDSASFLANVADGYSFNAFDDVAFSPSFGLSYNLNSFAYDITAVGPGFQPLFNGPGYISHGNGRDSILVEFTSGNVTAVGGNFWSTDLNFVPVPRTVSISLSDGTVVEFLSSGSDDFRGFTSDSIITSIRIDAPEDVMFTAPFYYSAMDNLYVGTMAVVPLPPAVWAGLGMLGLIGGVRAVRRRG